MRTRQQSGISLLLEVVLGIGLFATCLLLIMGLFPTAYSSMGIAKDMSLAANLARERAEVQRVRGFSDITNDAGGTSIGSTLSYPPAGGEILRTTCLINGQATETSFSRKYQVTLTADTQKSILVTVTWDTGSPLEGTGVRREVKVQTYVTQH